ncbi:MAG: hypothetical protein FJ313_05135 [Gemmatimonadetes bacterium]|nr:hypothetical protein [Gemmatimonadota bacterium]
MTAIEVAYFEETGPANTEAVLAIAGKRAEELGINTIVVATTSGATGVRAAQVLRGKNVVAVTHYTGFNAPNEQQLTDANRARLKELGATVHTATHALGAIGRAIKRKMETSQADEIVAYTLRLFGQGMKVACEVAAMAADAGLARTDEEVIAIAGTSSGADTAIVVQPSTVSDFFDLRVKEVLCKPRL